MALTRSYAKRGSHGTKFTAPAEVPKRKKTTYTAEENQWLLDLHAERPDLGWRDLSRRFYRQFGKDREPGGLRTFILKHTTT